MLVLQGALGNVPRGVCLDPRLRYKCPSPRLPVELPKTCDPEKTAQFYVETLGAKIVRKAGTNGYRLDLHGLSLNVTTFLESQTREQKYGMEHIAIDTDELDNLVEKLKAQDIHILEQTTICGGRRVCFLEGPDGVQLEFIEMKS